MTCTSCWKNLFSCFLTLQYLYSHAVWLCKQYCYIHVVWRFLNNFVCFSVICAQKFWASLRLLKYSVRWSPLQFIWQKFSLSWSFRQLYSKNRENAKYSRLWQIWAPISRPTDFFPWHAICGTTKNVWIFLTRVPPGPWLSLMSLKNFRGPRCGWFRGAPVA